MGSKNEFYGWMKLAGRKIWLLQRSPMDKLQAASHYCPGKFNRELQVLRMIEHRSS